MISRAPGACRTDVGSPFCLIFSASNCAWGALAMTAKRGLNWAHCCQHQIDLGRRAERKDLVAIRVPRHHVERVFSDGPRGAQNRDFLLHTEISRVSISARGSVGSNASTRSKHAPMAGQQPTAVLHARAALDQRFDQITRHTHGHHEHHGNGQEPPASGIQAGIKTGDRLPGNNGQPQPRPRPGTTPPPDHPKPLPSFYQG